jgi:serine/threonine protein kinase
MHPDHWKKIEAIYQSAVEQPESERSAFVRRTCQGDEELFREVEEMLEAQGQAGSFLAQPAAEEMGLAQDQKPNGTLIGKRLGAYEILSPLGKGGMGEVYRARDIRLDRIAAVKILPPEVAADPGRLHRFVREA